MVRLTIYAVILAIAGVVLLVQKASAHLRRFDPHQFRPVLGPIVREYRTPVTNGPELVARAAAQVPGMSVVTIIGDAVFLNSRPHVGRLDDGAGFFVRVISTSDGRTWRLRYEGQPKTSLSLDHTARSGFVSVERHLRQALARLGHRLPDGLDDEAPAPAAAPATSPTAPTPPAATPAVALAPPVTAMRVRANGAVRNVAPALSVGRDPSVALGDPLVLDDPLASKTHAVLRWNGTTGSVEDRGSTNGTYVQTPSGRRPVAPGTEVPLAHGDTVVIGDQRLDIQIGVF